MSNRRLFFIGSSLVKDRTLSILKALAQKPAALDHYAILPRPITDEELRKKRKEYGDVYRIRPIWIPVGEGKAGFKQLGAFLEYLVQESHSSSHSIKKLQTLFDTNDLVGAANLYDQMDIHYPFIKHDRIAALIARGKQYTRNGDLHTALKDFDQAIAIDPLNPDILFLRGVIRLMHERWLDAISDLETCVNLNPNQRYAHTFWGLAILMTEDIDSSHADEQFGRALSIDPQDDKALSFRCCLYIIQGKRQEAKELMEKVEKQGQESLQLSKYLDDGSEVPWYKKLAFQAITFAAASSFLIFIKLKTKEFFMELLFDNSYNPFNAGNQKLPLPPPRDH
jgi:tetratricopeptide (TPR) repeat protein